MTTSSPPPTSPPPDWAPPPDRAARDSFLGDGYFSTWCADVSWRLLSQASADARYAYGESIITRWQFPLGNFSGLNEVIEMINVKDADGKTTTVPFAMPIFHFLTLLNSMDQDYSVLPLQQVGPHRVAGFASRTPSEARALLYSHSTLDAGSRSDTAFNVSLNITGLTWTRATVRGYQIDKSHNTIFSLSPARRQSDRQNAHPPPRMKRRMP